VELSRHLTRDAADEGGGDATAQHHGHDPFVDSRLHGQRLPWLTYCPRHLPRLYQKFPPFTASCGMCRPMTRTSSESDDATSDADVQP
jgi:hypothetical protein